MPKLAKIIKWDTAQNDDMAIRFPKGDEGVIEWGSSVTVQGDQVAVFFRDGKPMGILPPGRHTLTTQNVAFLTKFLTGFAFGRGKTPFTASVYFVSTKLFRNLKWGTPSPLNFNDPALGNIPVRGNGMYSIEIKKPIVFLNKIVGTRPIFRTSDIEDYLRNLVVEGVQETLFELDKPFQKVPKYFSEIGLGVKALKQDEFMDSGLEIKDLKVLSISTTPEIQAALNKLTTDTFAAMAEAKRIELELAAKGAGEAAAMEKMLAAEATGADKADAIAKLRMAKGMGEGLAKGGGASGGGGGSAMDTGMNLGLAMMMPQMMSGMMAQQSQNQQQSGVQAVETPKADPMAKLKQLKELLDAGIITQEEFDAKKAQWMKLL